jgi:hypothetical protein
MNRDAFWELRTGHAPGKLSRKSEHETTSGLTILKVGVFLGMQIEKERKEKRNVFLFFFFLGFHPPSVKLMPMIQ